VSLVFVAEEQAVLLLASWHFPVSRRTSHRWSLVGRLGYCRLPFVTIKSGVNDLQRATK